MRHAFGWMLFALLFVASCDSISNRETEIFRKYEEHCPPEPDPGSVDYFPLMVGETWVFDYQSSGGSYHGGAWDSRNRTGTLTWTVESRECQRGDTEIYTVYEELEGTTKKKWGTLDPSETDSSMGTFSQTRQHTFTVSDSVLLFMPYFSAEVERFGPASGPDTLEVRGEPVGCILDGCGCTARSQLQLARGRGLVSRRNFCPHGVLSEDEESITRQEENE
jgi:hypothetical protein